jgi:lysozyme family protein
MSWLRNSLLFLFLAVFYSINDLAITKTAKRINNRIVFLIDEPKKMADFAPIFKKTEGWEGGYQNYPEDKANYTSSGDLVGTNRGISAIAYEQYLGREPSEYEMRAITQQIAEVVYRKLFWNKIRGDEIKDQDVADIIFATYIGNPAKSNKIVQAALASLYFDVSVSTPYSDDVVKAINKANPKKLFYAIKEEKRIFLESLRATYPQFINGWMRKLESFEYGSKKKWIIISVIIIACLAGGYVMYRKGHYKKIKILN